MVGEAVEFPPGVDDVTEVPDVDALPGVDGRPGVPVDPGVLTSPTRSPPTLPPPRVLTTAVTLGELLVAKEAGVVVGVARVDVAAALVAREVLLLVVRILLLAAAAAGLGTSPNLIGEPLPSAKRPRPSPLLGDVFGMVGDTGESKSGSNGSFSGGSVFFLLTERCVC